VIHSLTANIGQFGLHCNSLVHFFLWGRMFSRWIVTNITSARGTVHCRKIRIPCGDQLVICGLYALLICCIHAIRPANLMLIQLVQRIIRGKEKHLRFTVATVSGILSLCLRLRPQWPSRIDFRAARVTNENFLKLHFNLLGVLCKYVHIERITFLDFVHRLMFFKKHNVSETGSVSVFR
jgi:hypothetical protein